MTERPTVFKRELESRGYTPNGRIRLPEMTCDGKHHNHNPRLDYLGSHLADDSVIQQE